MFIDGYPIYGGPHRHLRKETSHFTPCYKPAPPLVESCMSKIQQCVENAVAYNKVEKVTPRVIQMVIRYMNASNLACLPTDKDGGFRMALKPKLQSTLLQSMHSPNYRKLPRNSDRGAEAVEAYYADCGTVAAHYEDPSLLPALMSSARKWGVEEIYARMGVTVKTHKPQGSVKLRLLHCATRHPMAAGQRFIMSKLDSHLRSLPHLLRSADQLVHLINTTKVSASTVFYKIDVADIYMSGAHDSLARQAASVCDPHDAMPVEILIKRILSEQYVKLANC